MHLSGSVVKSHRRPGVRHETEPRNQRPSDYKSSGLVCSDITLHCPWTSGRYTLGKPVSSGDPILGWPPAFALSKPRGPWSICDKMTANSRSRIASNRDALILAARRNLIEQGLVGLGFERIAASAGMTRKSVYNHFGSRAGLYEALMDDIGRRANFAGLATVWDTTDPSELVHLFFASIVRSWEADRQMFRMMIGLSAADPELDAAVKARIGRVRGIAGQLTHRLGANPGLAPNWTLDEANGVMFALASFSTFDAMAAHIGLDAIATRLTELARVPFAWP